MCHHILGNLMDMYFTCQLKTQSLPPSTSSGYGTNLRKFKENRKLHYGALQGEKEILRFLDQTGTTPF
jgi:hypothetical protein